MGNRHGRLYRNL